MPFNPLAAVHVHSHGNRTLDINVIGLAEEESLLVHSCGFRASRTKIRKLDAEDNLIFRADVDPVLTWSVRATVLEWEGLANAHPGPLCRQALIFANGGRLPHQFQSFRTQWDGAEPGILFYEDPGTEVEGGDAPEISFNVTLEFSDLDTAVYPGYESTASTTVGVGSGSGTGPVVLPALDPERLTTAALRGLLRGFFQLINDFGTAPLTLRLYDGAAPVSDALEQEWWQDETEPVEPHTTQSRNHLAIVIPAAAAAWQVTSMVLERNGITVATFTLPDAVEVPAGRALIIPEGALALLLTWPQDGIGTTAARQGFWALFNLAGWGDFSPAVAGSTVQFYTADPFSESSEGVGGTFTLPRSAEGWTLADSPSTTVESAAGAPAETAPAEGWSIPFGSVVVDEAGWNVVFAVRQFAPPLSIAEGDAVELAAADFSVTLS